jgi:DNA-binding NarL/FixJ family response regulator
VWTGFLLECPGIALAGCFTDILAFLTHLDVAVCNTILFLPNQSTASKKWPPINPAVRVVCIGDKRRGLPSQTEFLSCAASPASLFQALRGSTDCRKESTTCSDVTLTHLTKREHEILASICSGVPLKVIADEDHLSIKTIDTQVHRIMKKLGVKSRSALVLEAAARGWVGCPCRARRP